ncbi:actin-like isoform X2 [Rattus rattus]|uniref:actin-like isoform X2 n=1 Tax=Rattus rattus TaxID=10117 RepID=UPI0013F35543|nr:actin-like isoform X2 [Rattus rattus]
MDNTPIICDYGSGFSKVGFAGTQVPLAVFPTILGKMKNAGLSCPACVFQTLLEGLEEEDWFIGAEVQNNRPKLNIHYPIFRGAITNWDNVQKVWHYSFYHYLRIAPEQHPILVTDPPLVTKEARSKMTQILFETFNFPALYLANQGVLSLYASGRTSGTIIESGDGMTYFVPIANGYPLHLSTAKVDTAGQDLTMYLMKLLSDNGNMLETTVDLEHVRDLKEKCCYVALDYDMEMSKTSEPSFLKKFTLPDGKEISVGQETFMCPEVLFNPSLVGKNYPGIDMQAQQSITSCDKSHWKNLFGYIILSGGTSTCSGLRFRLQREIAKLVSPELSVKVVTSPYAKYGAWVGASILCSLPMFKDMWITNHEYLEIGPSVICRRTF